MRCGVWIVSLVCCRMTGLQSSSMVSNAVCILILRALVLHRWGASRDYDIVICSNQPRMFSFAFAYCVVGGDRGFSSVEALAI